MGLFLGKDTGYFQIMLVCFFGVFALLYTHQWKKQPNKQKTQPRFSVLGLFGPQGEPFPMHLTLRLTHGPVHQEQSLSQPAASSEKHRGSFASYPNKC